VNGYSEGFSRQILFVAEFFSELLEFITSTNGVCVKLPQTGNSRIMTARSSSRNFARKYLMKQTAYIAMLLLAIVVIVGLILRVVYDYSIRPIAQDLNG
jgi:uncharacterized membrane protein